MWEKILNLSKNPLLLLASLSIFLPIIVGIYKRKYLSTELKILLLYLIIYFIFDLSEWIFSIIGKKNNMFLHNISEWISTLFIALIYFRFLKTKSQKYFVLSLTFIVIIQNIVQFNWGEISGYSFSLNRFTLITFVFLHFYSILTELKVKNILLHPPFWISSAIMIFACGTLFIYLFWTYTLSTQVKDDAFRLYSNIFRIFTIIYMLILGISFWVSKLEKNYV